MAAPWCAVIFLSACATENFGGSRHNTERWASEHGFTALAQPEASPFQLLALKKRLDPAHDTPITVYLEGDGAPWTSSYHPPADPTPRRPVALALAARQPDGAVIYLGRPCQYLETLSEQRCSQHYWTDRRYAPEVIQTYDEFLTHLRQVYPHQPLRLVGFSGGGVIAMALLGLRQDIDQVLTVAAPVDLEAWTRLHDLTPLVPPPPPQHPDRLARAVHFVGEDDPVVPPAIARGYIQKHGGSVLLQKDFDHECCWSQHWEHLLTEATKIQEKTP